MPPETSPIRLLIIDADKAAAEQVCQIAQDCHFTAEAVADVAHAEANLNRVQPHVLLVDVDTLNRSDPELVRQLQARLSVPVIYLQVSVTRGIYSPGSGSPLTKPVIDRELYAAVHFAHVRAPQGESLVQGNLRSTTLVSALEELRQLESEFQNSGDRQNFFGAFLERLMTITRARYAAYGMFDADGTLQDFIVRGIAPEQAAEIGPMPTGRGLLRAFYRQGRPVRVANIAEHPESCTFPPHHPPMRSLLGAPVQVEGQTLGVLYLADKDGCEPFTDWDEAVVQIYAEAVAHILQRGHLVQALLEKQHDLERGNANLRAAYERLEHVQAQVLQSEKMASIGQLAAGVAHEINNPVGYISSNIGSLQGYLQELFTLLSAYDAAVSTLPADDPGTLRLVEVKRAIDINYLRQDITDLLKESQEGVERVRRIVQDLKDFSHVDEGEWEWADLHRGLDSTLNVVWNELKYKAEVRKEYGELPSIQCRPSQLNQVFMNLLVNAAHAIADRGVVTVRTGCEGSDQVWVEVGDTGCGIKPEHLKKIFDPFFTTKPIGKGTGLGLSVSFGIVKKHNGRIAVESELNKGTRFRIYLPVQHVEIEPSQVDESAWVERIS